MRLRRREIGHQHVDRPVGPGLQDELAFEFQRGAEQHRQHAGFRQQAGDRLGIIVASEDVVEQRPELDGAAAHVQRADLERHDMIVAGKAEFAEFGVLFSHLTGFQHDKAPGRGHAARRGACAETRFEFA